LFEVRESWGGLQIAVVDGGRRGISPALQIKLQELGVNQFPSSNQHGGMQWAGTLNDTNHSDGHSVKVWARVAGYAYGDAQTVENGSRWVNRVMYDGSALYVSQGRVQACTNRGILPDYCQETPWMYR